MASRIRTEPISFEMQDRTNCWSKREPTVNPVLAAQSAAGEENQDRDDDGWA